MSALKQPTPEDYDDPHITMGWRLVKEKQNPNYLHWRLFGYYCIHCSTRRLDPSLLHEHVKTCKHTKIQLKAREELKRALKGRSVAYATYI